MRQHAGSPVRPAKPHAHAWRLRTTLCSSSRRNFLYDVLVAVLRIDEALKDRQKDTARIGETIPKLLCAVSPATARYVPSTRVSLKCQTLARLFWISQHRHQPEM